MARGALFLFWGEFSKNPTAVSCLTLPIFYLSPPKCPRFMQFSRFSYTKPQVMGLLESLDSFDIISRYVRPSDVEEAIGGLAVDISPGQIFRKKVSLPILLTYRTDFVHGEP